VKVAYTAFGQFINMGLIHNYEYRSFFAPLMLQAPSYKQTYLTAMKPVRSACCKPRLSLPQE